LASGYWGRELTANTFNESEPTVAEKNTQSKDDSNFEEALARLEGIVGQLEDGEVGIAESLAAYEEGVKHLRQCHQLIERASRRI
jgi:exodeoxyribonuclease VII small subunit